LRAPPRRAESLLGTAEAQVAGSSTLGVSPTELTRVALGWSVKRSILDKPVYNDAGQNLGNIDDLIVAPDKRVAYVIIGVGGFIGVGGHAVAVPVAQIQRRGGQLVMAGATKDVLKAMPPFDYSNDTANRYRFVATAEKEIAKAKAKATELDRKAAKATADAKLKFAQQLSELQKDTKIAEQKVADMKRSAASRWKDLETEVSAATARLRQAL
jgi:sporulation protein YlmC with PRC-barrel domain